MANTTNFGWETPDDTDLVKDGAAAMRTLGSAIDTSFVDLKGGTTGQNLRKATNTDLDFTWAGDATNTVIDAEGDLLVGDSADTLQRLAIGTTGQVLTVDTSLDGKIKWATPASGGKVLQVVSATYSTVTTITSTSFTDTGLSCSITPSATSSKILAIVTQPIFNSSSTTNTGGAGQLVRGSTAVLVYDGASGLGMSYMKGNGISDVNHSHVISFAYLDSPSTTSATTYKTQMRVNVATNSNTIKAQFESVTSSMILLEIGV
jgi:hypothetical protein